MNESIIRMHRKQAEALRYLTERPEKREILYGGAKGGGKSFLGCYWLISSALIYPGTSWFISRESLIDLRKHTLPTMFEVMKSMGVDAGIFRFNAQDNIFNFKNESRIIFVSASHLPSDPMFERFGSMQNTGGFIEEAGEVDENAYQNLKLSIGRCKNSEYNLPFKLLITANPKKNWIYRYFIKSTTPDKIFIPALAIDNIYLPPQYHETLSGIKNNRDRQRLLLGLWDYDDDDNTLVQYEKINDLFTNSFIEKTGNKFLSCDIALLNDKSVLVVWDGMQVIELLTYQKITAEILKNKIIEVAAKHHIPMSNIIFDGDGIGSYLGGYLPGALKLNNNAAAGSPEYTNIKTRLAYTLADLINKGEIYINCVLSNDLKNELVEEIQCLKSKQSDTKYGIISKDDMKKLIGRSPDILDALMYRMLFLITRKK